MNPHFIEEDNLVIVFFPNTLRFYEINKFTKKIIKDMINNVEKEVLISKYNINSSLYDNLKNVLCSNIKEREKCNINRFCEGSLKKLTINITNTCNLACKYCYAHGGNYNSPENIMSIEDIRHILDVFYNKYTFIENIQIFGGEPTLNLDGIEAIGSYVYEKYEKGNINKIPEIGMVTNGTIANDRLIDLINKYKIHVTVSLDGPALVNDKMRVFKDGSGTENFISKNISILREKTKEPSLIEVTYHRGHEEEGIGIKDIISYGKNKFNINNFHIAPVSAKEESYYALQSRNEFVNSVSELMDKESKEQLPLHDMITAVIDILKSKRICQHLCEAGLSVLSVSTKGDVYPCFMLIDEEKYKMGNIDDKDLFVSNKFLKIENKLKDFSKFEDERCRGCFNNTICHGCIGANYFETGNIHKQSEVNCEMYKKITEKVIVQLIKNTKINNK